MSIQYLPSVWDRLIDSSNHERPGVLVDMEKIKESVVRDVENILNARKTPINGIQLNALVAGSVLNYGLQDFAHVTSYGTEDLAGVCRSIEDAICAHDQRLSHVVVRFRGTSAFAGRWGFDVIADLFVAGATEVINFQAVMDSSKQNFSVNRSK